VIRAIIASVLFLGACIHQAPTPTPRPEPNRFIDPRLNKEEAREHFADQTLDAAIIIELKNRPLPKKLK
jgi:hypothetical protein